MNFYASREYLDVVAETYFKDRRTVVEDVRVGSAVLRLLVVDGRFVITDIPFLDYHEPLTADELRGLPSREVGYARWVTRRVIDRTEWDAVKFAGFEAAPFVDWSGFPTFDAYAQHLKSRQKSLIQEHQRRRRRLAETCGELAFTVDDKANDVFDLARRWKSAQLHETGANDWMAEPKNVDYLRRTSENGLLLSSTLRAAGRLLSVWMGFIHDGVWSGWVFTYDPDPELRKYCLGHQLLRSMLEESHARKHRQFDFSIGGEEYKWVYATHARVLGHAGRVPFQQRLLSFARHNAKRALARSPMLAEMAAALRKAI
jgi:hypothetical protein